MAGYVVTVKHIGKYYDIRVSDSEIQSKILQIKKDYPQLLNQIDEQDVAEMIANDKIPLAVALENNSRQQWVRGPKCSYCQAGHRLVTTVLDNSVFLDAKINMPKIYVCEKCFETEYTECRKCKRDFSNKEITDGLCYLCQGDSPPLRAKRHQK